MKAYSIHDSMTGKFITRIELSDHDAETIEALSADSPEGFFKAHWAGDLLADLGDRTVYAILH